MKILIRPAKQSDALRILQIKQKGWVDTYLNKELGLTKQILLEKQKITAEKINQTKDRIKQADNYYVAEVAKTVQGFIMPRIDEHKRNRLGGLYVASEYRGKTIGSQLLEKVLQTYGLSLDIYLEVANYNFKAINFYKKYGFVLLSKKVVKHWLDESLYIPVVTMIRSKKQKT